MTETTLDHDTDSASLRVIEALADAADAEAHELEPLYDVVDPDSLDRLMRSGSNADVRVEFEYGGSLIGVRSDGTVTIDGTVYASE